MRKTRLYHTLIGCLCSLACIAAPRLTVVAVVDGMTAENLTLLRPYWQQGGLRTMSEEAFQTSVAYPHLVYGGNETAATLMCGTTPDRHGYTMDSYFLRRDRAVHAMLEDKSVHGIGTRLAVSPKALLSQTIADRMRLLYPAAKIYAVGIDPETAVILAGHAANACCWIDSDNKQWVATSAYSEGLPSAAFDQNKNARVAIMAAHQWTPRMDIPAYTSPTPAERKKGFSYVAGNVLKQSPEANTLVIELALALQKAEKMGTDAVPDILLLQFNTLSPAAASDKIASAEHEDMYLRLNQDLGFLMDQLNRRIGKENYQVLLIGRPRLGTSAQTLRDIHMPVQPFSVDRAAALTGTYLMALYGHERWVDGGYGQSVFLNRTLIEQKRLSLETIQRQVANFLMDFEGVQTAMPAYEVLRYQPLGASLSKQHLGDVVFMLQPGWQLMQNDKQPIDRVVDEKPLSPVLLWSGAIRPMPQGTIDATGVADMIW